jgi:hypothetical protein
LGKIHEEEVPLGVVDSVEVGVFDGEDEVVRGEVEVQEGVGKRRNEVRPIWMEGRRVVCFSRDDDLGKGRRSWMYTIKSTFWTPLELMPLLLFVSVGPSSFERLSEHTPNPPAPQP